jgi:hypothetical protein
MVAGGSFPGAKTDYVPPSNAEVKNGGAVPLFPSKSVWCLINQSQGQLYLYRYDYIIRGINSRRLRCSGNVECMGEMKDVGE